MKNINFITTLSPQQQREIRLWWFITCFSFLVAIIAIGYFAIPQLYALYELKKNIAQLQQQTSNYTAVIDKKIALKKENVTLSRKKKRIDTYINEPRSPHADLSAIMQAISPSPIKVEHIRSNKKTIDLTVSCASPDLATTLVKKIAENSIFSSVKLISLEQGAATKQFKCIIKITRA